MLNRVWKSSQYSTQTTVRLYQSCVLSTLLYGSECWRMTESAWPQETVHLPHQEPQKDSTYILAWDHLQPTASRPLQPREHGHRHRAKAMEMDRPCDETRVRKHHPHSLSLDIRGEEEARKTQEHLATDCGRGAQAGPEQTRVGILCCCPTCQSTLIPLNHRTRAINSRFHLIYAITCEKPLKCIRWLFALILCGYDNHGLHSQGRRFVFCPNTL